MWHIFKCSLTYMHSWPKKCKGNCASPIKNNMRHHARSCCMSKAVWRSIAEDKVTPSAGCKCTNDASRLSQWSAALLLYWAHRLCSARPKQMSQENKGTYVSVQVKPRSLRGTEYDNRVSKTSGTGEMLVSQTSEYRLQIVMHISYITLLIIKLRILHKMSSVLAVYYLLAFRLGKQGSGKPWMTEWRVQSPATAMYHPSEKTRASHCGFDTRLHQTAPIHCSPHFHLLEQSPLKFLTRLACSLGNQGPWYSFKLHADTSELSCNADTFCLD